MSPESQPTNSSAPAQQTPPAASGNINAGQKTNTMAIVALILAFILPLIGFILALVAKSQIKKRGEGGNGLATAALILSIVFMLIELIVGIIFGLAVVAGVQQASKDNTTNTTQTTNTTTNQKYTTDEQKAVNTSEAFLKAVKNSDFTGAYNQMGPELKKEYNGSSDFVSQAKSKNLNLIKNWNVTSVSTNSSGDRITVKGTLTASGSNSSGTFEFGYYKDTDGSINMLSYSLSPS